MTPSAPIAVEADGLTRRYGETVAVDRVGFRLEHGRIHGLLGRNGAGKTTLMRMLTGQEFPSSGRARLLGGEPAENADVLRHLCFVKESQRYPESFRPRHVFRVAPWYFENWDAEFAGRLADEFRLPLNRAIKKLSRGQLSAVGIILGLASRAPVTFFDEPYLGLDAVARQIFYDRLLEDFAEHPRTVVLSTHLIDEIAGMLEHVLVIDRGRILLDADADDLRGRAVTVVGTAGAVDRFVAGRETIHRTGIGGLASVTVTGLDAEGRRAATDAGLELAPVSLQQLIVHLTRASARDFSEAPA